MAEYTVNEILDMLSKIEETAADIMRSADNDKKSVNEEYAREKEKFDTELTARYSGMSDEDNKKYDAGKNARIEEIDREAKESIDNLELKVKADKDRLARDIFEKIIEV